MPSSPLVAVLARIGRACSHLVSWAFTRRAIDSGLWPSMGSIGDSRASEREPTDPVSAVAGDLRAVVVTAAEIEVREYRTSSQVSRLVAVMESVSSTAVVTARRTLRRPRACPG
jgi:hypothetical protein